MQISYRAAPNSEDYPEDPAAHLAHAGLERAAGPPLRRHALHTLLQLLRLWYDKNSILYSTCIFSDFDIGK